MRFRTTLFAAAVFCCGTSAALAQTQPYVGEVMLTAGTFCPKGWVPLDGRILRVTQYATLFSIIGPYYGGDGHITFALPKAQPILTNGGPPLLQCIAIQGVFPVQN